MRADASTDPLLPCCTNVPTLADHSCFLSFTVMSTSSVLPCSRQKNGAIRDSW
jgi:hypothetical protein